jgi:hypothetical protein
LEENPLQHLRQDLLGPAETTAEIQRRHQELQAQEAELKVRRAAAENAGEIVPSLYKDEIYQSIQAERRKLIAAMRERFTQPRLSKEQAAELRTHLTPEEKAELRQSLLGHLQSATPERKVALAAAMEKALSHLVSERGMTPDVEAAIAKARKLQEQINQIE